MGCSSRASALVISITGSRCGRPVNAATYGEGPVIHHELEDTLKITRSVAADVVSMIGVLEHVQHPWEIMQALRENQRSAMSIF